MTTPDRHPPRLYASDLDGTLLLPDGSASVRTCRAVADVEARGIPFVIVTGRPPRWIPPVVEHLGQREYVICANGAMTYDPARHVILDERPLEPGLAAEILDLVRTEFPPDGVAAECGFQFIAERHYVPNWDLPNDVRWASAEELVAERVTKLLFQYLGEVTGIPEAVRSAVGGRASVTWWESDAGVLVEVMAPGVHKASTLADLADRLGVPSERIISFGDGSNDVEMLQWSGWGVAMRNAHPETLAVADEITLTNAEDGVAVIIERELGGPDTTVQSLE